MEQKNALISVYNKEGIVEFAAALVALGWKIFSSGGTATVISAAGVPVEDVAMLIGGGAILGDRVKTLSRQVHAGLLATDSADDLADLEAEGIPVINLLCVDMYPLKEEIAKGGTQEEVIKKTDIGGPTMLRSAAKGRRIVMCDATDRVPVIEWLKVGRPNEEEFITKLVAKAEFAVADYCLSSAVFHGKGEFAGIVGKRAIALKYGENARQVPANVYINGNDYPLAIEKFVVVSGTDLSFNNTCDIDRLTQTITHIAATFDINRGKVPLIAIGVKHGNACGAAAVGDSPVEIVKKMVMGDPLAIFGGLVMLNFPVTEEVAKALLYHGMEKGKRIMDGILAPSFADNIIEMFKRKEDKCRLVANPALANLDRNSLDVTPRLRFLAGGNFMIQPNYTFILDLNDPELVKIGKATEQQEVDMLLAKAICDTSNSNTITIVNDFVLVGNGVGQQARVYGSRLALARAESCNHSVVGACAASDSFFPELDGVEVLATAGISAIITSSGSIRDDKVIEFCREKGIILYLIPDKKGRGFFGH